MTKLRPLTYCDECGGEVWVDDVRKKVAIPESVGHLAIVYKCSSCGTSGKAAMEVQKWNVAEKESSLKYAEEQRAIATALLDLESDLTATHVIQAFASYPHPPKIERGKHET